MLDVNSFKNLDLLVVSDKYPPNSVGGAEQSLHITLKELVQSQKSLAVITFEDAVMPKTYVFEGISVLCLPRKPLKGFSSSVSAAIALRQLGLYGQNAASIFQKVRSNIPSQDQVDKFTALRATEAKDFLNFPNSIISLLFPILVNYLRPKAIHADNYRAVLYVADAINGEDAIETSCLIRDNRFHCPRDDQSVLVEGKECTRCNYECAKFDAKDNNIELQKELLNSSKAYRLQALSRFKKVCVTSAYLKEAVQPLYGSKPIRIIRNAGDNLEFVNGCIEGIAELTGNNCLIVGMLTENKGQIQLLKSAVTFLKDNPQMRIHLAGSGARIQAQIEILLQKHDILDSVVFHGYLNRGQIYQLYRKCQIVLAPTLWPEPFGRVPLEAGLSRRPCVAFGVGGLRESIVHGETGFLVERGNYKLFLEYTKSLMDSPELRNRFGSQAYRHISTKYSLDMNLSEMKGVLTLNAHKGGNLAAIP